LLRNDLAWNDPVAVAFGRRMYEAIKGRSAPPDLLAAHQDDKSDVGVWVHYWWSQVRTALAACRYQAFEDRCHDDILKKRKIRGIRNLGAVARSHIVPGVLRAMMTRHR
jgi:hypothetical protein